MPVPQFVQFFSLFLGTGKMPVPQFVQFFSLFLGTGYADCFKAAIALPIYSDTAESSAPWETTSTFSC
jgi:hypothetical protein